MGGIKIFASLSATALAIQATPAAAQYMPHLDPSLYANAVMMSMNGQGTCGPMPESEIDEAREPAPGIMQAYFDAAQAGQPVSPVFKLTKKTSWTLGEQSVGQEQLDAQRDPLAVSGNSLDPQTLRFFRAGTHRTAQGQWLVRDADGNVAGVYNAQFEREQREWKLLGIEIFRADDQVAPIKHYCSEPGDLNETKVEGAEARVKSAERAVEKARERFARDDAKATEAEAKAAEKPNSSGRARRAAERRARADARLLQVEEKEKELAEAQIKKLKADEEHAQFLALTTPARNAHTFRLLDDDGKPVEQAAQ